MPQSRRHRWRVADVFDIDRSQAILVTPSTPLAEVVGAFVGRADLRGIFVVDAKGRLTGVITRQDLLHWAAEHLDLGRGGGLDAHRMLTAGTAQEASRPQSAWCTVHPQDPLEDAFRLMRENELIDIPVVDDGGKILGDVRLTEILMFVLRECGA